MCNGRHSPSISYRKLLSKLHDVQFVALMPRDNNRISDGIDLRSRYASYDEADTYLSRADGGCSVLEMMVALAIRCEEDIMHNPLMGDRTQQWFWKMIVNLGLGGMRDEFYDEQQADDILSRFIHRDYSSEGRGGLFVARNCPHDMRSLEIWDQMCWYINSIT